MIKFNIDCLVLIFNQTDKNSLYSCLLVNKEWCSIVVPILWKKFSWYVDWSSENVRQSGKKLSNTIISCLPPSSKQLLSDNGVKLPSEILLRSPLFNYISFCEFLLNARIINKIIKIVEYPTESHNLIEQEIYKLFVSQCNNINKLQWKTSQP